MHDLHRALQEFESGTDTGGSGEFAQGEMESDYEGENDQTESGYEREGYEGEGDYEAAVRPRSDGEGQDQASGVYDSEADYEGAPSADQAAVFDDTPGNGAGSRAVRKTGRSGARPQLSGRWFRRGRRIILVGI